MIVILEPEIGDDSPEKQAVLSYLRAKPGITPKEHKVTGTQQVLTEIYLVGDTSTLDREEIENLAGVDRVVKVSRSYAVLGRHFGDSRLYGFNYNGVTFNQDNLNIFAGLCAVDTPDHVEQMMRAVAEAGLECTRMGCLQATHQSLFFPGPRRGLPALGVRARGQVRYQGDRHGNYPGNTYRGNQQCPGGDRTSRRRDAADRHGGH